MFEILCPVEQPGHFLAAEDLRQSLRPIRHGESEVAAAAAQRDLVGEA